MKMIFVVVDRRVNNDTNMFVIVTCQLLNEDDCQTTSEQREIISKET
jgi:hypothetical protein